MAPVKTTPQTQAAPLSPRPRGAIDWAALYRRTVEKFPVALNRLGC